MSLEYLLDRLAIQDTVTRGATAVDTRQPDLFDDVFTEDAIIYYSPLWGPESKRRSLGPPFLLRVANAAGRPGGARGPARAFQTTSSSPSWLSWPSSLSSSLS